MRCHRPRTLRAALLLLLAPALPAAPAHAAAAGPPLRVVTYNICGNMCAAAPYDDARRLDSVVAQASATGWNADRLFLQEVCEPQYDEILARLAPLGFQGHYGATLSGLPEVCGGHPYGNAVLVRGAVSATADLDLTVGGESEPIRVPCVRTVLSGTADWSCSVHLYWDDGTRAAPEARRLAAQAGAWRDQGLSVLLAGDFNHSPRTATTEPFYSGGFVEADGANTPTFGEKKIDYVFSGHPDLTWRQAEVLPLDPAVSDHRMLRAVGDR
ncbi:endonuclease/exonuclease/phosphatase family protein [Streptomyces racemochromogenes]|uniref:Endonuclease/exonuclease/phosphatase family protein n=1 Tax=Streptomyces racemochromogenes TaxID=67353 RepID=A0ABW7PEV7_9ACTN